MKLATLIAAIFAAPFIIAGGLAYGWHKAGIAVAYFTAGFVAALILKHLSETYDQH